MASGKCLNPVYPPVGKSHRLDLTAGKKVCEAKGLISESKGRDKSSLLKSNCGVSLDGCGNKNKESISECCSVNVDRKQIKSVVVLVKTLQDKCFSVTVHPWTNILELKLKVFEQDNTWEMDRQRIIFKGKELCDHEILLNCGLCDSIPTVHVVMRPSPNGASRRRKDTDVEKVTASKTKTRCAARSEYNVKEEPIDMLDKLDTPTVYKGLEDLPDSMVPMEFTSEWPDYSITSQTEVSQLPWDGDVLSPLQNAVIATDVSRIEESSFVDMMGSVEKESAAHRVDDKHSRDVNVVPSSQGRAYDLSKVDEKLRKRLVKNRLSAERSRQRKQAHVETLEFELSCCRSENEHLRQRVASLEAQLAAFTHGTQSSPTFRPQMALAVNA